ncbi:MAG: sulfurtransferase [Firmicutes bacterium]|nr:sulfurtransferase [Bacillota bacterium]
MKNLVSARELLTWMDEKENVFLFDCRFDLMDKNYGRDAYEREHIKGAYPIDLDRDLVGEKGPHGGRQPFRDVESLRAYIERFGVNDDSVVVAYDDGDMQGAGRLYFQLRQLGLKNVYALDGGLKAYRALGGETETGAAGKIAAKGHITTEEDRSFIVDMEYVRSKLDDEDTVLLDARAKNRYLGLEEPVDKKMGHIPGAKSYYFRDVLTDDEHAEGSFLPEEALREHFGDLAPDKELILYCGSGVSLCVNALALDKIGRSYKIYPGSFSDWISYEDNEIRTEEE